MDGIQARDGGGSDGRDLHASIQDGPAAALPRLSSRYSWDSKPEDALAEAPRVILRTMNVGTWEDLLDLERLAGQTLLTSILAGSTAGALTPRAWSFWHHRLGLADVKRAPPPRPTRVVR